MSIDDLFGGTGWGDMRRMRSGQLFEHALPRFAKLARVALLKECEAASGEAFVSSLPEGAKGKKAGWLEQAKRCALSANFEGVEDFSAEFYEMLDLCSQRQQLGREFVRLALEKLPHGFGAFDARLIRHCSLIQDLYDPYYLAWSKAVQGNDVAAELAATPPPAKSVLYSHYTIITHKADTAADVAALVADAGNADGGGAELLLDQEGDRDLVGVPYIEYFAETLTPICMALQDASTELLGGGGGGEEEEVSEEQQAVVAVLSEMRTAFMETDVSKLEEANANVDRTWCRSKYYIQIVHDIEYGYGDALRVKAIPDFSMRFVDEQYQKENDYIKVIQAEMVAWFDARGTELSRDGLQGLSNSMAAIYFIGQSIPNRSDIKKAEGCKIYFDPISTANRMVQTAALVKKVVTPAQVDELVATMDAVDTLTYHVAAHEVGHAIYNLDALSEVILPATKTLLEEPRAELTALLTMRLMVSKGMISEEDAGKHLASFAMQDLRRFAMFDSTSTRPYTVSALHTYGVYERCGFLTIGDDGLLTCDRSKAPLVLAELSAVFDEILKAEDERDGAALEAVRARFEVETPMCKRLVEMLK